MSSLLTTALEMAWLFLPGIAANIAPVFATRFWPAKSLPVWEAGLGKNKTWRGVWAGVGAAAAVGVLHYIGRDVEWVLLASRIPATTFAATVGFAILLGAAALLGDAIESFIKRRLRKQPGESWAPWDQIDFAIGMIVVVMFVVPLSFSDIVIAVLVLGVGSFLTSVCGVTMHIKKSL